MKRLLFAVALFIVAFGVPATARAQVGSSTDILTGKVVGPNGEPIAGARIEVLSLETQVARFRTTNEKGQWTLLYPDGGGNYRVTAKAIGMAPVVLTVNRQADEDRLEVPLMTMSPTSQRLGQIVVRAPPSTNTNDRATAGSTEKVLSGEQLYRLPVDASDPALVASLAPGVILLGGSDTTANSFVIAGQRADQNQITLDGLSFGSGSVPSEAVRNTRVITNTYDVARGQFTGGQVASTTRSGTNVIQGSAGYVMNQPDFEFPDTSSQATSRFTSNQLSFGVGGPFVQDQSFWFISANGSARTQDINTLLNANNLLLQRSNASPDSVGRFLSTLNRYGIPTSSLVVPNDALTDRSTALTRMDFALGDRHTLTVRGDWNWTALDATRLSTLSVPTHGGDTRSLGGGLMTSLSSQFDNGIINEARIYAADATNRAQPFLTMPQGSVRVTSALPDSLTGISNFVFGGNAGMPTSSETKQIEVTDEASYFKAGSAHRFKLGFFGNITTFNNNNTTNQLGSWSYNSLTDFDNNLPSQFTRTLTPTVHIGDTENAAVYLGDAWRVSRAFQMAYGVRAEGTRFDGRPQYNPDIQTLFGRNTSDFPSETHISPRLGFTWTSGLPPAPPPRAPGDTTNRNAQQGADQGGRGGFGGGGGGRGGRGGGGGGAGGPNMFQGLSTTVIRGGFGEFRGKAPTSVFTNALDATGLAGSESQLVCIGSATPIPNWSAMINDPTAIPNQCLGGNNSGPSVLAANKPNVTTFAPDFEAPRAWRGSLGVQRRILQRYTVNIDATYARGTNYYGVTDLNLNTATPQFVLSSEGNRPVYVSPAAIVPTTGALQSLNSRVQSAYGNVYSVNSNLGSESKQITTSINGFTPQGINMSLSYTYSRSRDQSSASGGSAGGLFRSPTTDGNPNINPWGTSDNERRHNIQLTATWPVHPSVELTAVVQYLSGTPYTPLVGGDINGDGASNDRAFIYNPSATGDTAVANGMNRLLAAAPSRIKSCLESQIGQIAGRNSCTTAWTPNVSMQINYRPDRLGLKRNLMISFALTNPIAGMDLLLHGESHLQGWGQPIRANSQLLYVTGFDPVTNNFKYSVNEKFGDQRSNQLIITRPFQVQLTARYTIGPDYARAAQLAAQAAARGRGGNGTPADTMLQYTRMVQRYVPNIFRTILQRADTLKLDLTASQQALLTVMADSIVKQIDTLGVKVAAKMRSMGNNADPAAVQVQLRGLFADAQELGAKSIAEAQVILTKEQWAKLPEQVRHPQSVFGPIQGGGGRGGGRPPQ